MIPYLTVLNFNVEQIMSLLSLCLNATYFSFHGVIYQQIQGTPMGSTVSVVMPDMVMEDIEKKAMDNPSQVLKAVCR